MQLEISCILPINTEGLIFLFLPYLRVENFRLKRISWLFFLLRQPMKKTMETNWFVHYAPSQVIISRGTWRKVMLAILVWSAIETALYNLRINSGEKQTYIISSNCPNREYPNSKYILNVSEWNHESSSYTVVCLIDCLDDFRERSTTR